jgi:hypothetical protein
MWPELTSGTYTRSGMPAQSSSLPVGRTSFRICSGRLYSCNRKVCRNPHTLRRPVAGITVQAKLTGLPERVWLALACRPRHECECAQFEMTRTARLLSARSDEGFAAGSQTTSFYLWPSERVILISTH